MLTKVKKNISIDFKVFEASILLSQTINRQLSLPCLIYVMDAAWIVNCVPMCISVSMNTIMYD